MNCLAVVLDLLREMCDLQLIIISGISVAHMFLIMF